MSFKKMMSICLVVVMVFTLTTVNILADEWSDNVGLNGSSCYADLTFSGSSATATASMTNNGLSARTARIGSQVVVTFDNDESIDYDMGNSRTLSGGQTISSTSSASGNGLVDAVYSEYYFTFDGEDETLVIDVFRGSDF